MIGFGGGGGQMVTSGPGVAGAGFERYLYYGARRNDMFLEGAAKW